MNLKFMREEALAYFKENFKYNYQNYFLDSPDWIYEKYENPLEDSRIVVPEFSLQTIESDISLEDYNNVKILYTNLKELSNTQAADERLWVGLSHSIFWKYLKN